MAAQTNQWLPIAGGTDVMVQFAAGTLVARKLLSIWKLPELRRVEVLPQEVRIGAGCTYTEMRRHEIIVREFPILAQAAAWTGGIANQNRGTLGGNIANASPAADSLPALLVYEAKLILVSARGERRVEYVDFHTGYKRMDIAADELIQTICLPRGAGHFAYARKAGARSAQAISKVCIAALGRVEEGVVNDVRIAAGSVAPTPIRLRRTESTLSGKVLDRDAIAIARQTAVGEISPINDIRSTARYRAVVVANLVGEFLEKLAAENVENRILARWNGLSASDAENEILPCCGSWAWARGLASRRPFHHVGELLTASDEIWRALKPSDWMEAFLNHPRIGERGGESSATSAAARSAHWSTQEQNGIPAANDALKSALAEANQQYEKRFGYIFIVCATGKSAAEMLDILRQRLQNDAETELLDSAEQQRQITHIRLKKWLAE